MNDNDRPGAPAPAEWLMKPGMIMGRVGPGDRVIFDDPEMLARMRRGAAAAERRAAFKLVDG